MGGYGRFMRPVNSRKFLHARNCMLSFYQNISTSLLKREEGEIFLLKPKRPQTPFLLYVKTVRPKLIQEYPHIKSSEIVVKASKEWANLDPTEKEDFKKQYNQMYTAYVQELKEYENSLTDEQKQLWKEKKEHTEEHNKELARKRKIKAFGKPRRPISAFLLYVTSKKSEKTRSISFVEWIQEVTEQWKNLSDTEKKQYYTQASQLMAQYEKDIEEWEKRMIGLGHIEIIRRKTLTKYKQHKEIQEN